MKEFPCSWPVCLATILLCLLLGCAVATMVSRPGDDADISPYAPVNERSRSGVIKYVNQGMESIVKERREDAYRQMYEACNGKYRIDSEGPRVEGGTVIPVGKAAIISTTEYWYIQFSCVGDDEHQK